MVNTNRKNKIVFLLFLFVLISLTSISVSATSYSLLFNNTYGEMKNFTNGGYVATPTAPEVYTNITNLSAGFLNGFNFGTRTIQNGGDYLQAKQDGIYLINGKITIRVATGGIYGFGIVKNNANPETTGDCYSRSGGGNLWLTVPISCFMNLSVNDNITLVYDDEANPVQKLEIEKVEVNVMRISSFEINDSTSNTYDKTFWYYLLFLLIPIALFFLGYGVDDNWIKMLSGILFAIFGIYIAINQFPLLPNLFLTEGFYIVLICLGGFIFLASALDEIGGSGL